jgi:cytochrome c553
MAAFVVRTLYLRQPSAAVGRGARNLRVPDYDMMRPLPLAACLALAAALPMAALTAQDAPAPAEPAAAAQTAPAAAPAATPVTGNAENGKQLAYTCQGCHGVTGYKNAYPTFHVPRIGGQSAEYLTNALNEYKNGNRKHPTMQAQSQSFSEQDIADIAAFLSTVK